MSRALFFIRKNYLVLTVLIITFLAHITYINNDFVWIDHNDIEEEHAVLPLNKLSKVLFIPFGQTSFYRPMVTLLNSLDFALYHKWAPGYHFTNLLLHLIATLLIGIFLSTFWKLTRKQIFWASVVFGIHPMSILIVGAVTRRQESLMLIFIFLSIYLYAKAREKRKLIYELPAAVIFFLGLLTKETVLVVVPALAVLWEIKTWDTLKRALRLWVMSSLAALSYLLLRFQAVPKVWSTMG
ncbi:hypothetical protein HY008_01140, partial [Candidatus Woesebacteria bacterium]|nr:hypothetical protein [Candidatus Woesebacteria bacterium]